MDFRADLRRIDAAGSAGRIIQRKVCLLVDSIKECTQARDLEGGRAIHADARDGGLDSNVFLASSLIYMYSKCGSMADARRVFDGMAAHDVVAWTALILGYAENGDGSSGLEIFARMGEWCRPNPRTFVAALKACSSLAEQELGQGRHRSMKSKEVVEQQMENEKVKVQALEKGMAVHSRAAAEKFDSNIFVSNTLIDMYANCRSMEDARVVFENMPYRSVVSWSALILGYVNNGDTALALEMFCRMNNEGFVPNSQTFVAAIKACTALALSESWSEIGDKVVKVEALETGMAIHARASRSDLSSTNNFVTNTLIDMYASCGSLRDADRIFYAMPYRTIVSWNAMILGYAENGDARSALGLFSGMIFAGSCRPNVVTYAAALKACARVSTLESGKFVHSEICKNGFENQKILQASLMDVYGKAASSSDSQLVFDSSPGSKDVVSWNALLGSYSRDGNSDRVLDLFDAMQLEGIRPDNATILCILTACSHSGLIDKGKKCFRAMSSRLGLAPGYEQYVCMVDLLGRSNELDEALLLLRSSPLESDPAAWRTLLAACEKWKNFRVGKIAFGSSLRLGDKNATAYKLMASIYEDPT